MNPIKFQSCAKSRSALVENLENRLLLSALVSYDSSSFGAGDCASDGTDISASGRYVAFASAATNLVVGVADANGASDIFVRDVWSGITQLITRVGGSAANGASRSPSISADGRYIAFESDATNLVDGLVDDNHSTDVFVADRVTGETALISVSPLGETGKLNLNFPAQSISPRISADGGYVVFESEADNLTGDIVSGTRNVFVRDIVSGTTLNVSQCADGFVAFSPAISNNGAHTAYFTKALAATGGELVIADSDGDTEATLSLPLLDGSGAKLDIAANAAWVAFVPESNSSLQLWSWPSNALISVSATVANQLSIDRTGSYIAFDSCDNLTDRTAGSDSKVYLYGRETQVFSLLSLDCRSTKCVEAESPAISDNGRRVVFSSDGELVNGISSTEAQIYRSEDLQSSQIRGRLWFDADGNRLCDPGERPRKGVKLFLDLNQNGHFDSSEPSATTNGRGEYCFSGLSAGDYSIMQIVPARLTQSYPAPQSTFDIAFNFPAGMTRRAKNAFQAAARRWEQLIIGDLPNYGMIDDLLIDVYVAPLSYWTLAESMPTQLRPDSKLPARAMIRIGQSSLAMDSLQQIVEHEIAHALGFGPLWSTLSLSTRDAAKRLIYVGPQALSQYRQITGDPDKLFIPVENFGGWGTAGSHWDSWASYDSLGQTELMYGWMLGEQYAISSITVAAMADLGYTVDLSMADRFGDGPYLEQSDLSLQHLSYGRFTAYAVHVNAGEVRGGYDFGDSVAGSISGHVYKDVNFDDRRQSGEPALRRQVFLDLDLDGVLDDDEPRLSSTDGSYRFDHLPVGTYCVRQILHDGWVSAGSDYHDVIVRPGQNRTNRNFGSISSRARIVQYSTSQPFNTSVSLVPWSASNPATAFTRAKSIWPEIGEHDESDYLHEAQSVRFR